MQYTPNQCIFITVKRNWALENKETKMNKELPKLNGASKQITWAEQIRETILEQLSDEKKQLALTLQMCEHASWWINSRFTLTNSIEAGLEYASLILKKIPVLEQIAEESKETNQDKANFMLKKENCFSCIMTQ